MKSAFRARNRPRPRARSGKRREENQIDYEDEDDYEGNKRFVGIILGGVLAVLVVAVPCGCKSRPMGPYVEPRVEGQVLAADNGQPLVGVKVSRGKTHADTPAGPPKGGQLLMLRPPFETGPDGRFALSSQRVLSVFRGSGWSEVLLTFEKPGYLPLATNFSATLATNSTDGEPLVDIGAVSLQPAK
jgi:hypothetical protein